MCQLCAFLKSMCIHISIMTICTCRKNPGQKARLDRIENIEKDLIEEYNRQRMSSDEDDVFPLPTDPFVRVSHCNFFYIN